MTASAGLTNACSGHYGGPPPLRRRCGGPFTLHRQQLEDLHRALAITAGQEWEAVGEGLRRCETVGLDDRVADQVAACSFSAVIANGRARPERAADVDERR